MNKEFKIINNKVVITNEKNEKSTREISDNIEEILIVENNIEEIENLIKNEKKKIKSNEENMKRSKFDFSLASLYFLVFILHGFSSNLSAAFRKLLCCILWATKGFFSTIIPAIKLIEKSKKQIFTLDEHLNVEKNKLNELNKNKTADAMYFPTEKKQINRSQEITKLQNKLFVIRVYMDNKRKFINYYKKGILRIELNERFFNFDNDIINFIEELIINDIKNNNELETIKSNIKILIKN